MLRLLLVLALLPSQEDDPRALVRRLGDDDVAARDRAGRALEAHGMASINILSRALEDPDLEIRSRAAVLVDRIDPSYAFASRVLAQREHKLNVVAVRSPGEDAAATDGAVFVFERRRWIEGGKTIGGVLRTSAYSSLDGEITWSVASAHSTREFRVETCSTHSPEIVFLRGEGTDPCTVVLKGTRRWLCDVPVHFVAPVEGDRRRIGKFTVTVEWPHVVLRCDDPQPPSLVTRMLQDWDIRAKGATPRAWLEAPSPPDIEPAIFFPEAKESEYSEEAQRAWCGCGGRPARLELPPATSRKREVRIPGKGIRGLHEIAELSLVLHVPVEEPFELTSPPLEY